MNSRSHNTQYVTTEFRLLDDPNFCHFMRSAAFATYMMLRRYVWRSLPQSHPVPQVNELLRRGYLVSAVDRKRIARKLGLSGLTTVTRHIHELSELGVIRKVSTGRINVYVLGSWEDKSLAHDGRYVVETFLLDQIFGPEPFEPPRPDDVAPGLWPMPGSEVAPMHTSEVAQMHTSEVAQMHTSEVAQMIPNNKEENKEENRESEGAHGVLYVEY